MKLFSYFVSAIVVALPVLAQEPVPEVTHAPKITCDQAVYNFGEMDNSTDVEHTFIIKNEGDLTLIINNVRPTCGCTIANISEKEVPPGGQTEIATKLSLRGRQGTQHKVIRVESNDPATSTLELALEGSAVMQVELRPNQVFFGRLATDAVVTSVVEIVSHKDPPLHVNKAESNAPFYQCTVLPSDDPKISRVEIVTKPPLPEGQVRAVLNLSTDNPGNPLITLPVSAYVVQEAPAP